jgi:3-oxoacyl-[acyl-carrier-protein] synthase II
MAFRAIRRGSIDAALCGGVSAKVAPLHIARLEAIGAVCTDLNLAGPERSRPFDSRRSGFVPGEGAVLFVLERESAARRRGAQIYARILGYGSSMAAQHIVAPHSEEIDMTTCMSSALQDASVQPGEIDCVNAHGTSTRLNDFHEGRALSRLFAECPNPPMITATKSLHGHLIAASGAMEVLCALASFKSAFIPAIRNLEDAEPAVEIPLAESRVERPVRRVLKNSFGMGGLAASLVLEGPDV